MRRAVHIQQHTAIRCVRCWPTRGERPGGHFVMIKTPSPCACGTDGENRSQTHAHYASVSGEMLLHFKLISRE